MFYSYMYQIVQVGAVKMNIISNRHMRNTEIAIKGMKCFTAFRTYSAFL